MGEAVRAFVPIRCRPRAGAGTGVLRLTRIGSELALARLSGVSGLVPSVDWLLYSAIRKEALLTSQIEGTQATLTDLFDEEAGFTVSNTDDVEEVTNYLRAFRLVRTTCATPRACPSACACCAMPTACCSMARAVPASSPVNCAARRTGSEARGRATPCSCRRRRTRWPACWRPGALHSRRASGATAAGRVALIHAQFETIHPFLDGNGRIGRLLIAALLEHWGLLPEPLLYLSGYLKQHQAEYYRRLSIIRTEGDWEAWVAFFLEGVPPQPPTRSAASSRSPAWSSRPETSAAVPKAVRQLSSV